MEPKSPTEEPFPTNKFNVTNKRIFWQVKNRYQVAEALIHKFTQNKSITELTLTGNHNC